MPHQWWNFSHFSAMFSQCFYWPVCSVSVYQIAQSIRSTTYPQRYHIIFIQTLLYIFKCIFHNRLAVIEKGLAMSQTGDRIIMTWYESANIHCMRGYFSLAVGLNMWHCRYIQSGWFSIWNGERLILWWYGFDAKICTWYIVPWLWLQLNIPMIWFLITTTILKWRCSTDNWKVPRRSWSRAPQWISSTPIIWAFARWSWSQWLWWVW